ncbi:hypothetical protein AAE478_004301 [Parahypoxylon ruwenzoriense]
MASPNAPLQNPPPAPSSSPSSSSSQQPTQANANAGKNSSTFAHNIALGVTPTALLALFLPPRRLDARAAILGGVVLWGTNQLVYDYSGTSSVQRMQRRMEQLSGAELPEKAKQTQMRIRAERAERARRLQAQLEAASSPDLPEDQRRLLEEQRRKLEGREAKKGLLERIWMGDQDADWKEKRDRREREALSEGGGGYWGLIADQISEVWNQGGKKSGEENAKKEGTDDHSKKN